MIAICWSSSVKIQIYCSRAVDYFILILKKFLLGDWIYLFININLLIQTDKYTVRLHDIVVIDDNKYTTSWN